MPLQVSSAGEIRTSHRRILLTVPEAGGLAPTAGAGESGVAIPPGEAGEAAGLLLVDALVAVVVEPVATDLRIEAVDVDLADVERVAALPRRAVVGLVAATRDADAAGAERVFRAVDVVCTDGNLALAGATDLERAALVDPAADDAEAVVTALISLTVAIRKAFAVVDRAHVRTQRGVVGADEGIRRRWCPVGLGGGARRRGARHRPVAADAPSHRPRRDVAHRPETPSRRRGGDLRRLARRAVRRPPDAHRGARVRCRCGDPCPRRPRRSRRDRRPVPLPSLHPPVRHRRRGCPCRHRRRARASHRAKHT
jgi:hypothetical protein